MLVDDNDKQLNLPWNNHVQLPGLEGVPSGKRSDFLSTTQTETITLIKHISKGLHCIVFSFATFEAVIQANVAWVV